MACFLPFTAIRRLITATSIDNVLAGLLQRVASRSIDSDTSRLQSFQNAAGRLFGRVYRYNSIEECCVINSIGCQSCKKINSRSGCLDTTQPTDSHLPTEDIFSFLSQTCQQSVKTNLHAFCRDFIVPSATRNITYH